MKSVSIRPRAVKRSQDRFALVVSQYNIRFTQLLADHAMAEISTLEKEAKCEITWAPGTFEIPLISKLVAESGRFDVVVAIGVIIKGETPHADIIVSSATHALQQIALDTHIPVIDCLLFADSIEKIEDRCSGEEGNRGIEAARAAVSMARSVRQLNPQSRKVQWA